MGLLAGCAVFAVIGAGACLLAWTAGPQSRRRGKAAIALVVVLVAARDFGTFAGAAWLRESQVQAFVMSSGSMAPTLQLGDKVLVYKADRRPRHGDIVAYRKPSDPQTTYCHRVVAVENETVEFKDGGIYVNGELLRDGPFAHREYVSYDDGLAATGKPYNVPAGNFFVAGDNSARSLDSRFQGPIPNENLIGKARKKYWPVLQAGPLE